MAITVCVCFVESRLAVQFGRKHRKQHDEILLYSTKFGVEMFFWWLCLDLALHFICILFHTWRRAFFGRVKLKTKYMNDYVFVACW